jgi:YHS domain-containing protein
MAIDPVCKMNVDPENAPAKAEYEGETYYFCAPGCKAAFERNPEKYLHASASERGSGSHHKS